MAPSSARTPRFPLRCARPSPARVQPQEENFGERKCYTAEISDVDCSKSVGSAGVTGWEAFYAYNAPHETSANTGYEESEVALIYFI